MLFFSPYICSCPAAYEEKYDIHHYQRNTVEFCSLCNACKRHADVRRTIFDFSPTSLHRTEGRVSNEQYMDSKPIESLPLPMLFGIHISRFLHDTTHSQLLGTSKVLSGSILTYLSEVGEFGPFPSTGIYEQSLAGNLRVAFQDFKLWLRTNHLLATQPRFIPQNDTSSGSDYVRCGRLSKLWCLFLVIIIRHLVFRDPKGEHNFGNHPCLVWVAQYHNTPPSKQGSNPEAQAATPLWVYCQD